MSAESGLGRYGNINSHSQLLNESQGKAMLTQAAIRQAEDRKQGILFKVDLTKPAIPPALSTPK